MNGRDEPHNKHASANLTATVKKEHMFALPLAAHGKKQIY